MRYAILFPGQGCQYKGMGWSLFEASPHMRDILSAASEITGCDLALLIRQGSLKEMTPSAVAQPLIVTVGYAMFHTLLTRLGEPPTLVAGHSLGEITALTCAGALDFLEAVRFAHERGTQMDQLSVQRIGFSGIATDLDLETLQEVLHPLQQEGYVDITAFNTERQHMVGGENRLEKALDDAVSAHGGQYIPHRMIPMRVNVPLHCKLMSDMLPKLSISIEKLHIQEPFVRVFSTVSASFLCKQQEIAWALQEQTVRPVLWKHTTDAIREMGIELMIDNGPNRIIKNLLAESKDTGTVLANDHTGDRVAIQELFQSNSTVADTI